MLVCVQCEVWKKEKREARKEHDASWAQCPSSTSGKWRRGNSDRTLLREPGAQQRTVSVAECRRKHIAPKYREQAKSRPKRRRRANENSTTTPLPPPQSAPLRTLTAPLHTAAAAWAESRRTQSAHPVQTPMRRNSLRARPRPLPP